MPSPFPGMDPFIESRRIWSDFHLDLAAEIRAQLNARIQPGCFVTAVTYVTYDVIEVARSKPCRVSRCQCVAHQCWVCQRQARWR